MPTNRSSDMCADTAATSPFGWLPPPALVLASAMSAAVRSASMVVGRCTRTSHQTSARIPWMVGALYHELFV